MSYDLEHIREEIKKCIEVLKDKKKLCPRNDRVANYINGEIAGLGIALHQIENEIFGAETDVFTSNDN